MPKKEDSRNVTFSIKVKKETKRKLDIIPNRIIAKELDIIADTYTRIDKGLV